MFYRELKDPVTITPPPHTHTLRQQPRENKTGLVGVVCRGLCLISLHWL